MQQIARFDEPEDIVEESFEELVLGGQALFNKKPSIFGKFGHIHHEREKIKIKDDEILLFTEDKKATTPVMLKVGNPPKSFGMLITAQQGGGKSGFVKCFMDQFRYKGFKFFCIEIKGYDFVTMNRPQDDPKSFEVLNRFGLKPYSYKFDSVMPAFVADEYTKAITYKLDVADFNKLPKTTQISAWCNFLGIKEMDGRGKALHRVLRSGPNGKSPSNIKEMIEYTIKDIEEQRKKKKEIKGVGGVSTGLLYLLEQKVATNEIGRKQRFDFVESLAKNDMVVLNAPLDSKNVNAMNTYISVALNQIITDRNIYVKTGGRKGLLSSPICVVLEESDSFIGLGEHNLTKHLLYSVLARYRHIGISLMLVTQNPALIDPKFVRLCQYIATTQVNSEEQRHLLNLRSIPKSLIHNDLARLEFDMNSPVKEWCIIDPNEAGNYLKGYPIWPTTKLLKEGQGLEW